jgi:hypothetical protein
VADLGRGGSSRKSPSGWLTFVRPRASPLWFRQIRGSRRARPRGISDPPCVAGPCRRSRTGRSGPLEGARTGRRPDRLRPADLARRTEVGRVDVRVPGAGVRIGSGRRAAEPPVAPPSRRSGTARPFPASPRPPVVAGADPSSVVRESTTPSCRTPRQRRRPRGSTGLSPAPQRAHRVSTSLERATDRSGPPRTTPCWYPGGRSDPDRSTAWRHPPRTDTLRPAAGLTAPVCTPRDALSPHAPNEATNGIDGR